MIQESFDKWYANKFCMTLNKPATETFDSLIKGYGDATLSRTVVLSGTKLSKKDEKMLMIFIQGRLISSRNDQNVEVVEAVMAKNHRLIVRIIAKKHALL